jgi:hypothetical protein
VPDFAMLFAIAVGGAVACIWISLLFELWYQSVGGDITYAREDDYQASIRRFRASEGRTDA